jgi:dGTPase
MRDVLEGRPTERVEGDVRNEFERDYGRALYSTPVRRLRDKAQVFPLEEHGSVRTRLAHSLEVSSVARSLGLHAARFVADKEGGITSEDTHNIGWIAATCGLIHDVGNPPFGHAGELAIASWFKDQLGRDEKFFELIGGRDAQKAQDFLNFEGNAQTIRLISRLQLLADENGLNFTSATFSAACKYLAPSHNFDKDNKFHERAKPGFFASEQTVIDAVRKETGTFDRRNPITYLVEAADDIVYSTVDLEDGIKKGVLDWANVEKEMNKTRLGKSIIAQTNKRIDDANDRLHPPKLRGRTKTNALAILFRTIAITEMVTAALEIFRTRYTLLMQGDYHSELLGDHDCEATHVVTVSKQDLLRPFLYSSPDILSLEIRGRTVIHELMTLFWEAAKNKTRIAIEGSLTGREPTNEYQDKLYLLFSDNYRNVFERSILRSKDVAEQFYARLQLVTDQIAGMTDTYACRLHKQLTNVA